MSLKEKIKRKLIHLCGGYTKDELLPNRKIEIVKTEYPIEKYKFSQMYILGTPKEYIDEEAAKQFTKIILDEKLYESETINNPDNPIMLKTTYSIYIGRPSKD
jgi:hypothetical protein